MPEMKIELPKEFENEDNIPEGKHTIKLNGVPVEAFFTSINLEDEDVAQDLAELKSKRSDR
tara:strand:- start:422 stop:604 length:183 start_codon:yes stop_codon:yes gene_type:complete